MAGNNSWFGSNENWRAECEAVFQHHATYMNRKWIPWTTAWRYEIMSGSIVFLDEWQLGLPVDLNNYLRCVFNYRTSLICGEAGDQSCRTVWELGRKHFPKWRGYRPRRNQYCPVKAKRFKRIERVSDWKMERSLKEWESWDYDD